MGLKRISKISKILQILETFVGFVSTKIIITKSDFKILRISPKKKEINSHNQFYGHAKELETGDFNLEPCTFTKERNPWLLRTSFCVDLRYL